MQLRFCVQMPIWKSLATFSLALGVFSLSGIHPVIAQTSPSRVAPVLTPQEPRPRTLMVTGQGVVTIPTTKTQVNLGVEVQGATAAEVQQELARRSSAVVDLLRSRNVKKLQTTSITLNPIYSNSANDVQRLTGYVASNIVSFEIDTQLSGQLLDDAIQAGATRINGINFIAADEAIATAQQQALRAATQDAQRQADTVLGALNFTRQEIVSIVINSPNSYPMPLGDISAARVGAFRETPVIGGEQQVRATVTLYISY
jgi:uncharacterized protein YggE